MDELIDQKVLFFERFIGITDVPGPNGMVKNVHEGMICSVHKIIHQSFLWGNTGKSITFLPNFKIAGFGNGTYKIKNKNEIIARFGGRVHDIKINPDYHSFLSIRRGDLEKKRGSLLNIE